MNIEPTLKYLLTRSDPFICLVKGQWGVGKTYFIKKFIRENRAVIVKSNFAYISLFGVSSVEELIQAIFVNSVSTKTLDTTLSSALSSDEALTTRAKYLFDRAKPLLDCGGVLADGARVQLDDGAGSQRRARNTRRRLGDGALPLLSRDCRDGRCGSLT